MHFLNNKRLFNLILRRMEKATRWRPCGTEPARRWASTSSTTTSAPTAPTAPRPPLNSCPSILRQTIRSGKIRLRAATPSIKATSKKKNQSKAKMLQNFIEQKLSSLVIFSQIVCFCPPLSKKSVDSHGYRFYENICIPRKIDEF